MDEPMARGRLSTRGLRERTDDRRIKYAIENCGLIRRLEMDDPRQALKEAKKLARKARSALIGVKPAPRSEARNKAHAELSEQDCQRIILAAR
jgi:hypothetical protein